MSKTNKRKSDGCIKLYTATREEARAEAEALREALEEADRLAEPLFWRMLMDDEDEYEVIARLEIIGPEGGGETTEVSNSLSDDDTTSD